MSSYGYDPSPLLRLLHFITRTFALGTFFGVHVRMYWAALLLPLLMLQWMPAGTAVEGLVQVTIAFVGLFLIIWTHEMGHIACGFRYHIRTDLITLGPLGGVAHLNAPASRPSEELWIALAGPAVHLVWLAVFWPLSWWLSQPVLLIDGWRNCPIEYTVWYLVAVNQGLLLFNLLPIFPLDGGRALRSLLAMRVHPNRATMWAASVGIAGGVVLMAMGMFRRDLDGAIPMMIGLSCVLASLHERRLARHVLVYQHGRSEPWQTDADAWKRGGVNTERRPGWLARRRAERLARRAAAAAAEQADLDQQVDSILERLHKVGMPGLSERERAVLKRAAARRRGAG